MSTDAVGTFEHHGLTVSIHQDIDPCSPLEWDNLGTVVAYPPLAREYRKGSIFDRETTSSEDDALMRRDGEAGDLLERYLRITEGAETLFFYFADYGSGGARLWETDNVGASGFITVDRDKIVAEYGDDSVESRETARRCLSQELKALNQYVEGDVYGFVVHVPHTEHPVDLLDSCWGFYGFDYAVEEAKEAAEWIAHELALEVGPDLETAIYGETR